MGSRKRWKQRVISNLMIFFCFCCSDYAISFVIVTNIVGNNSGSGKMIVWSRRVENEIFVYDREYQTERFHFAGPTVISQHQFLGNVMYKARLANAIFLSCFQYPDISKFKFSPFIPKSRNEMLKIYDFRRVRQKTLYSVWAASSNCRRQWYYTFLHDRFIKWL